MLSAIKPKFKRGENTLAEYEYYPNNGKLKKILYGNGFSVEYEYNTLENVSEIWYTYGSGIREKAYSYEYTSYGAVYKFVDHISEKTTVYTYDTSRRLIGFSEYTSNDFVANFSSDLGYNDKGELSESLFRFTYSDSATAFHSIFRGNVFWRILICQLNFIR